MNNSSSGGGGTTETTSTPAGGATAVGVVEGDAPEDAGDALVTDATQTDTSVAHELTVPIVGYEVMEQRARFTVYKVHVQRGPHDSWFIFRRYTDFVRLNRKLKELFPGLSFALPPKRWFGDNFDVNFLEDRLVGLQVFVNNVTGHKVVCASRPVWQFFCFDEPPSPHDSLEESRALCESLEEEVYELQRDLQERDATLALLRDELALAKSQAETMATMLGSVKGASLLRQQTISSAEDEPSSFKEEEGEEEGVGRGRLPSWGGRPDGDSPDVSSVEEHVVARRYGSPEAPASQPDSLTATASWELSGGHYTADVKLSRMPPSKAT